MKQITNFTPARRQRRTLSAQETSDKGPKQNMRRDNKKQNPVAFQKRTFHKPIQFRCTHVRLRKMIPRNTAIRNDTCTPPLSQRTCQFSTA